MQLAARYGELWVAVDSRGPERELVAALDRACAQVGRDPATLGRLALVGFREQPLASIEAFRDVRGRYAELGFTDLVVHWPRSEEPFRGDPAVLERIAAERAAAH